jgi:regulator of protease activity HflC (stomatin/prohibitin superfamily)
MVEEREWTGLKLGGTLRVVGLAILVLVVIILVIFGMFMVRQVAVGHAVILVDPLSGSTSEPLLGPTFVIKAPWVRDVDIFHATDSFEDIVPSFSSDQLEMQIEVLARWSLDPDRLRALYNSFPNLNYKEKAIESIMEETIRLVTKNYTALETIEFRDIVTAEIESAVVKEMATEVSLAGALMNFELDLKNIGYPAKYTSSIEDKLVAEQQQISAEFEKQRVLILANASAHALIIEASGEAQSLVIEANGTRQAIETILMSVSQSTNQTRIAELYLWVQTLQRIAPDVEIMIVGADNIPILIPANTTNP